MRSIYELNANEHLRSGPDFGYHFGQSIVRAQTAKEDFYNTLDDRAASVVNSCIRTIDAFCLFMVV